MSSPLRSIYTVEAGSIGSVSSAKLIAGDPDDRKTCQFLIETADHSFGIVGTFDEINDMCATFMSVMFSWPLANHHPEWFDDEMTAVMERYQDGETGESA